MSEISKCPVCEGRCVMTMGFYAARGTFNPSPMNAPSLNDQRPTPCRSCNGRGIVTEDFNDKPARSLSPLEEYELREGS